MKKILSLILTVLLSLTLVSCSYIDGILEDDTSIRDEVIESIDEDGYYTSKEDLSLYIYSYGKLPNNFVRKKEASKLGWKASKGNLWEVTDKMSIGGDRFGNREGILPKKDGRKYFEADVNYKGGYRGPERIVYSNDGLIYYTEDHYDTFILLYGDE